MDALTKLIEDLGQEANRIQIQGRALTPEEEARVKAINQALPLLEQARTVLAAKTKHNLVTYKITSDQNGMLKRNVRTACNFWNRFIIPKMSVVIRLGVFTADSNTIARAYRPVTFNDTVYGRVEFNTKYLSDYTDNEIAGTLVHEIGHTLGFGQKIWHTLYDANTCEFTPEAVEDLKALSDMRVEADYGPGTEFSHWDEERHDKDLMTGIKDNFKEHVLPVTIDIMRLFEHKVIEPLAETTSLDGLLSDLSQLSFSRQVEAKSIDLDYFKETEILETVPRFRRKSD